MTYPVFLYNMLLAATYVVLAVVFFWLHRSRSSRLAWWLMILFACSFVDNGTYFMKEVFTALGHPDPLFATFYQAAEALFIACYPFIIRMISGCFYDDMPSKRSMVVLGAACAVATALGVASGWSTGRREYRFKTMASAVPKMALTASAMSGTQSMYASGWTSTPSSSTRYCPAL